jgi:PAS domain-containing protein
MVNFMQSEGLYLFVICLLVAGGVAAWLAPAQLRAARPIRAPERRMVFFFDSNALIDASSAAQDLIGKDVGDYTWADFRDLLGSDFPGFPETPEDIRSKGQVRVRALNTRLASSALCEWVDGITRIELCAERAGYANASEPDILKVAMDAAPYPVWRLDAEGAVRWCNSAYASLSHKIRGRDSDLTEPLFPNQNLAKVGSDTPSKKSRTRIQPDGSDKQLWFEVTTVAHTNGTLCYAVDVNAVVDAEVAQRNFVQTLAKTFAQLSIGLAIFDRNQRLALFNPALIDLTTLPADFLSSRPDLLAFFDRLRDRQMMPEPKDYTSWREQLTQLVAAATDGNYQETWSLPSGAVYSVSGRPHPDGAVAFLFEDITAEITLTRRFRSELELGQGVMDAVDDAIAVFAPDGTLTFSNRAYNRMWGVEPDSSFAQVTVVDATRTWHDKCTATPTWGEIRDFVGSRENRLEWWSEVQLRGGDCLACSVHPIASGATMVSFRARACPNQVAAAKSQLAALSG